MGKIHDKYDVVIVGAGIGGLVCGCYLAKAGVKVLIVEKNDRVGGYCSFIEKDDYRFNLTTCMVGGVRKSSTLDKIFYKELKLKNRLFFKKEKYSNTIITEDGIFNFDSTGQEVFNGLLRIFPSESRGIRLFSRLVFSAKNIDLYLKYGNIPFGALLNSLFLDERIKNFFTIVCGNFGYSPKKISAFSALIYYKETVFSEGCHVIGGAEQLPKSLLDEFRFNNGDILLSAQVDRINISKDRRVENVVLADGMSIKMNYLVACCDIKKVLFNIIGKEKICKKLANLINNMSISSSAVIVYVGLQKPLKEEVELYKSRTLWVCPKYNLDTVFCDLENDKLSKKIDYLTCYLSSSDDTSRIDQATIYMLAPFLSKMFWKYRLSGISKEMINEAEYAIKGISTNIKTKYTLTPHDLYSYSFNSDGAITGWASLPSQNKSNRIPQGKIFENLYVAGQWSTLESGQGGIAMASFSGRRVANMILKNTGK